LFVFYARIYVTQLFFNNEKRIQFFIFNRIRYTRISIKLIEREREKKSSACDKEKEWWK
jgi:hypothetical protein